jgi:hypothetical protein
VFGRKDGVEDLSANASVSLTLVLPVLQNVFTQVSCANAGLIRGFLHICWIVFLVFVNVGSL